MIFQGRFDQPLRVKTFFLRRIIARKFRLPLRCQSRLERDFFVSQFLAFSSSGDPIFQTRIRELKAGTVGHFSRSVPLAIASLSFSLEEKSLESSSIKSSSPPVSLDKRNYVYLACTRLKENSSRSSRMERQARSYPDLHGFSVGADAAM